MAPHQNLRERAQVKPETESITCEDLKPEIRRKKDPNFFIAWVLIKTCIQISMSCRSAMFLWQSRIAVPGYYNPTIWSTDLIFWHFVVQGIFELLDFSMEFISIKLVGDTGTMAWDSVVHHVVSALYFLWAAINVESAPAVYTGLVFAGICCQVIGPFYNMYRLGFRGKTIVLFTIICQFMFRWPLGLLSWSRAFYHFDSVPIFHFAMLTILSALDYRWSKWMIEKFTTARREDKIRRKSTKEFQWLPSTETAYNIIEQWE